MASISRTISAAAEGAARRFPWYADMLAATGFFDSPDPERIPILGEEQLAETYYADPGVDGPAAATYLTSGTSTGRRKRVVWTTSDHSRYVDQRAALIRSFAAGDCRTACADLGTGHAAASALEIFERAGLEGTEILVDLPIADHVRALRKNQPDLIYTMPMILERIVAGGGPGYAPRRIVVVGDLAPAEWRRSMARMLGMEAVQVMDVFGSIEVGAIAFSLGEGDRYAFHDHIIAEVVATPDSDTVPDGDVLLLTSLAREGFPAVRYASGDLVAGFWQSQAEGSPRSGYARHLGRIGSELKHGEMLNLHSVAASMARIAPGIPWSVRRVGLEVVIEIDESAYRETLARSVRSAVRSEHPAVDAMIRNGLVGDVGVEPRSFENAGAKRRIRAHRAGGAGS